MLPYGFSRFLTIAVLVTCATIHVVDAQTLRDRHLGSSRERATNAPRGEHDQALIDGWPLYRTERGQTVFNEAMATLKATDGPAPQAAAFKGCVELMCALKLPQVDAEGWMAAGRLWVSPEAYMLMVKSPRQRAFSRRSIMSMRYFVFHEFHNSSRNTDVYDTISSHSGSVFVPFYMSKTMRDARGRSFVVVAQVAPHDVVSTHATNMGSAGPGIEVALNTGEQMEPLQGLAGSLVAAMVKEAVPRLEVVNHRGSEGLAMLQQYKRREQTVARAGGPPVVLPFTPAAAPRVAVAQGRLDELILRRGASVPLAIAQRGVVPQRRETTADIAIPSLAMGFAPADAAPRLLVQPRRAERPTSTSATGDRSPALVEPTSARASRPWFRWFGGGG